MLASAPPLKMFMNPSTVLCLNAWSSAEGSTPGTGTLETKRKITTSAKVKSNFSRMSAWDLALIAAWRSCGRCAACCLPAAAIALTLDVTYVAVRLDDGLVGCFDLIFGVALGLVSDITLAFHFAFTEFDDCPAGSLDLLLRCNREPVGAHLELLGEFASGQYLHRFAQAAQDTLLFEQVRCDLRARFQALKVVQVDGLVLHTKGIAEAAAKGELLDQPGLAALKETARLVSGTGLLAFETASGIGALACGVAAADALAGVLCPARGLQLVGLH